MAKMSTLPVFSCICSWSPKSSDDNVGVGTNPAGQRTVVCPKCGRFDLQIINVQVEITHGNWVRKGPGFN